MNIQDLLKIRLHQQLLTRQPFTSPAQIVQWFGAVQAQDFFGALWGVGQRLNKPSIEATVEKALTEKTIIRTWPMRGTLHFVAAQDARWMLKLLAPRVMRKIASIHRKAGLDQSVFEKAKPILIEALKGGRQLTRDEIYQAWEQQGISTKSMRGMLILGALAYESLICFGTRNDKQQTFVLLDEWIPKTKEFTEEESLKELAIRYFTSHGPATIKDICWWAGITMAEAKRGIELAGEDLEKYEVEGKTYWTAPGIMIDKLSDSKEAYLLPAYDEYTIAYKDRSDLFDPLNTKSISTGSGFWATAILNGRIVGTWRRTLDKTSVTIELASTRSFSTKEKSLIQDAANDYGSFLGKTPKVTYV